MVQIVMVGDTDAEAKRLYERHVQYFFQRCAHIYPGFLEAPGYKSVDSLRAVLPAPGAQSSSRPAVLGGELIQVDDAVAEAFQLAIVAAAGEVEQQHGRLVVEVALEREDLPAIAKRVLRQ